MTKVAGPQITVVVTTLRRHRDLTECLQALQDLDDRPEDVLVVARNDDEQSRTIAQSFGARTAVVTQPGLAAAIETGLRHVETEIVAFVDDDARPHRDWLGRIRAHFEGNPDLGFLGGRDDVDGDSTSGDPKLIVGVLRRGKLIGNHHLGKGPARPAMHAKGANMAYRLRAVRGLPLGQLVRGGGAQHGNELFLCFAARRRGFEGLYDPAVRVDHYPAPRQLRDGRLEFSADRLDADIRNSAAAIGLFLGLRSWLLFLGRAVLLGDRRRPGLAWALASLPRGGGDLRGFGVVSRAAVRALADRRRLRDRMLAARARVTPNTPQAPGL